MHELLEVTIAQAQDPDFWKAAWAQIAQAGMGAVLLAPIVAWFALRLEKILNKMIEAHERGTVANMIMVLNTHRLDEALREMADEQKRKAEDALKR